jgi:hypothetical protein
MEAYTGYVQDGHAGRNGSLRGELSDEDENKRITAGGGCAT